MSSKTDRPTLVHVSRPVFLHLQVTVLHPIVQLQNNRPGRSGADEEVAIVVAAFFVLTMVSWLLFVIFTLFVITYV